MNQHEAETAEALAQVLAAKAGIDLGHINVDDAPAAELEVLRKRYAKMHEARTYRALNLHLTICKRCVGSNLCMTGQDLHDKAIAACRELEKIRADS